MYQAVKYCAFCGSQYVMINHNPWQVECVRCKAEGPVKSSEDDAIQAWNTRHEPEVKDA